jgi:hypothetical protein
VQQSEVALHAFVDTIVRETAPDPTASFFDAPQQWRSLRELLISFTRALAVSSSEELQLHGNQLIVELQIASAMHCAKAAGKTVDAPAIRAALDSAQRPLEGTKAIIAHHTKRNNNNNPQQKAGRPKAATRAGITCYHCGKPGHLSKDCGSKKRGEPPAAGSPYAAASNRQRGGSSPTGPQ